MAKTDVDISGSIAVSVDDSGLEATLNYTAKQDAEQWNLRSILDELSKQGITEGISHEAIRNNLDEISRKGLKAHSFVAASGLPVEQPEAEQFRPSEVSVPEKLDRKSVV